ncbi:MAG: ABC transporter ATP-binding protein [Chloroflexi bacterium]|nr:ABC transporter ATP-binding protein [Chloroflexota bacterium]MBM3182471.1 ABC transporter ATP-binding protein [Chloroflexota bacterium]MBM4453752.1 ABC transporter ATP-binding protein [Chloroflexota bacterium]
MIELENISKVYDLGSVQVTAIDNVSLRCHKGEFVSIMGASGSGKSTVMNILGCLDSPTSGSYHLDDQDVSKLNDDQLARIRNSKIGFIFQSYNLLPKITALANVQLPLIYAGTDHRKQRTIEALKAVGISKRAHHRPSEMSGGEQQRVAIARALVNNPSIILADEPTGNLDSTTSHSIMSLLCELNKKDITIVIVTHEEDIAAFTHRTIYLRDGKIIDEKRR